MAIYTNFTYNSNALEIINVTPKKVQSTRKTVIGKTLVETQIIGLDEQKWELQVSGIITTTLSATRATLEGLDSATAYAFVDGVHDGSYYIRTGSLVFEDTSDDAGMVYRYNMILVEA